MFCHSTGTLKIRLSQLRWNRWFSIFVCNLNLSLHLLWQVIFLGSIAAQYSSTWEVENQICLARYCYCEVSNDTIPAIVEPNNTHLTLAIITRFRSCYNVWITFWARLTFCHSLLVLIKSRVAFYACVAMAVAICSGRAVHWQQNRHESTKVSTWQKQWINWTMKTIIKMTR